LGGRIKQPGREIDLSRPSRSEVKNEWSYTSTPPYIHVNRGDFVFFNLFVEKGDAV
jgi:hypothetical protein